MSPEAYEHRESPPPREVRESTLAREVVVHEESRQCGLPSISWGAIFAGLFVILALSWLIQMLGLAIGVTVADATNSITMEGTLTPAVTIWTLVCYLISFFIGGLVAARMAGRIDETTGMLHGFTVWSVATTLIVVLAYWGVVGFVQTGAQLIGQTAQGIGVAASTVATGVGQAASGVGVFTQQVAQQYGEEVQTRLYDRAAEIAAQSSAGVTEADVRGAINDLDGRTLRRMVIDLANNDHEGAADLVAQHTRLSPADARSLVDAAYAAMEEQFGVPGNQQTLAEDLRAQLAQGVAPYFARLDQSGQRVTERDIQQAINELDARTMQQVAGELLSGNTVRAKRTLARNTTLTTEQINVLIDGATTGIQQDIQAYEQAFNETVENISAYIASLLWLIFAGSAAALAAAIGGGYLGADSSRRLHPHEYGERTRR
jgi:hypothetical protein